MGRFTRRPGALMLIAVVAACATPDGGLAPSSTAVATPSAPMTISVPVATDAGFTLPDVTNRPLTTADLLAMLPAPGATGTTRVLSNGELVALATVDAQDAASDVTRFLRLTGVTGTYPGADHTEHIWIDLLDDADSAHRYLLDTAGDIVKGGGGTHSPDAAATDAEEFPIDVGEEAIGLLLTTAVVSPATETAVVFRLGRIVVYASIEREDDADVRVALQYLADDVARRVIDTLTTGDPTPPRPDHPPYRFETTITVAADDRRWTVESQGRLVAGDLACTVRRDSPDASVTTDIVEADGLRYWRPAGGDWVAAGDGNQIVAALEALCPAWALDGTSLIDLALGEGTAHMVNAVPSLGYRSDLDGLATALGSDLTGSTLNAFAYWIGQETPWLVELSITITGDGAVLAPLTGGRFEDLGEIAVTIRHRVLELGTVDAAIIPPA